MGKKKYFLRFNRFWNLFSGKIIQESDPSLWWVANVCLRPGQNKKGWMWMLMCTARVYFTHVVLLVCVFNIYILPGMILRLF